jgi:hypothetical protein
MGEKSEKYEKAEKVGAPPTTDPMSYLFWGLIIIAAGVALFLERLDVVRSWWWTFVLLAGVVLVLNSVTRAVSDRRRFSKGRATWGILMIAAGLIFEFGERMVEDVGFPLFIILLGVLVVVWGIWRSL